MLSLYAAALQRNPKLGQVAGVQPSSLKIRALGLISGMFYTIRKDSIGLLFPKAFYGENYKKHPFYPYMNPEHEAVAGNLPPAMLITSKHDHLRNYTCDFAAALKRKGASCYLKDFGNASTLIHAFPVFNPALPESMEAVEKIAAFFTTYK